jgi:hypothetical protein
MWDYSDRRDSTRISQDELREAEIDECVLMLGEQIHILLCMMANSGL